MKQRWKCSIQGVVHRGICFRTITVRDAKNKENERKKNLPVLLLLEHQSRQSAAKAAKQIARPCPDSYNKNKRHEKKKKKKKVLGFFGIRL